jgi:hypothetical protein
MITADNQLLLGVIKGPTLLLFKLGEVDLLQLVLGLQPFRVWLVTPLDDFVASLGNI